MHGIKNKYVLIIILPTKEKVKIFEQLNKGFKKYIDWNEHQTKISEQAPNHYSKLLIDSSFQIFKGLLLWLYWEWKLLDKSQLIFSSKSWDKKYIRVDHKKAFDQTVYRSTKRCYWSNFKTIVNYDQYYEEKLIFQRNHY